MSYRSVGSIKIHESLYSFMAEEALPGTGVDANRFWSGVSDLVRDFAPRIVKCIAHRGMIQTVLDDYLASGMTGRTSPTAQRALLQQIGYFDPEPEGFSVATQGVDEEISVLAGPQLVVPATNARYVLNAANARWGSLYDALYGTDVIPSDGALASGARYNPVRGQATIDYVRDLLDQFFPLEVGSHKNAIAYVVENARLSVQLADGGGRVGLRDRNGFAGFRGEASSPACVLLRHNGLHMEIVIDRTSRIGSSDPAGISDIVIESALSTIFDCEDSVAAVDVDDKILIYRNWLGLMRATLRASFDKGGHQVERSLAADRVYATSQGGVKILPGRSLLLVRNVGHHMYTDAVLDSMGYAVPEGIIDAAVTCAIALHDLKGNSDLKNSRSGSIYVVKPKMHGAAEVAIAAEIFGKIEGFLGLKHNTIKMGLMDEERRTSVNLAACIHAARERVFFINTGFLDRTGDEIHSCMRAGAVVRKDAMRDTSWITAYEQRNVTIGLACGMKGHAQIGKGMWAKPDHMAQMMTVKINHPRVGASTAWVPSPTAATLHALHYHFVNVAQVQTSLLDTLPDSLDALLTLPLGNAEEWSKDDIQDELDNSLQGILGYVSRWVDRGVGCSKVADLHDVGLMEDRATLRISSQHIANWMLHGVISEDQVNQSMRKMAAVVDRQNEGDADWTPLCANYDKPAFQAAKGLVFKGLSAPNGYTEPVLHRARRAVKNANQETALTETGNGVSRARDLANA